MPIPDANKLKAELEQDGEYAVRTKLVQDIYGPSKIPFVENWLKEREEERQLAVKAKELSIAEKSADAAKKSADSAKKSVTISKVNAILTAVAVAVSILSLIISLKACQ